MTIEETRKFLMMVNAFFPSWKVENPAETAAAWHWALQDFPIDAVNGALQIYINTNNSGFAPSVSQIIGCLHKPNEVEQLSEGEAWNLVKRAIQDSGYHAEERFAELPPIIRRCVGSPNMLHQWSQTESSEVNTVVMSNFQRTYRAVLSKQEYNDRVPIEVSNLVKAVADKLSGNGYLELKDEEED